MAFAKQKQIYNLQDKATIKSVVLAYRIQPGQWETDEQFARLLALLTSHREVVDELSLVVSSIAYIPLEKLELIAKTLKVRIAELRAMGFRSVGIEVTTLGHGDIGEDFIQPIPFQPMIGHDGKVSTSCPCPNSSEFHTYTKKRFSLLATTRPDFIWIDDDFRASHHGPIYPCFCPICLEKFGYGTDRETLVNELNVPKNNALRQAWSDFIATSLDNLCVEIRQAVAEVDQNIELGLMTIGYSHSTYTGYPIRRWMKTLGVSRGRPGHGYYTDQVPRSLTNKIFDVGRQVRDYPPEVEIIEYELENYPYITLDKASRTVINECTISLMMGCNGIAFNVLKECAGQLDDYESLFNTISFVKPSWEILVGSISGLPLVGLWPADHNNLMANREVDSTGWFWEGGPYDIQRPNQVAEMGIPFTTDPRNACGVLLAGKVVEAFTTEELREMLARGVLMDAMALKVLWRRGLGKLTGVKVGQSFSSTVAGSFPIVFTERFTDHPMNSDSAGDGRSANIGLDDEVCSLEPIDDGVGDLAHLIRYDGIDYGCCLSIYSNVLGGRVAVSSYVPWKQLGRGAKRRQLITIADWITGNQLPVVIEQTARVLPLVRRSNDWRRIVVVLFNTALDPTGPLKLRLRAHPDQVFLVSGNDRVPLPIDKDVYGNEVVVSVPSIPAWDTAVLIGF